MHVEAKENDPDRGVGSDGGEILIRHQNVVDRRTTTLPLQACLLQLLLQSLLPDNVDTPGFDRLRREYDVSQIRCGGATARVDFLQSDGDAERAELFAVGKSRFGGIVGDKGELLRLRAKICERLCDIGCAVSRRVSIRSIVHSESRERVLEIKGIPCVERSSG